MKFSNLFKLKKWLNLFANSKLSFFLSDEKFIKLWGYINNMKIDIDNPKTFNDKLQWLKLYDRKPIYTTMVDKFEAKKYVASKIGEEFIIPTIGVWDDPADIDFDSLPEKFVLKCNHNSGLGMIICKNKSLLDIKKTRAILKKGLKQNYYKCHREWPYKEVKRKIIAEAFLEDGNSDCLVDYKFFCFNGVPKFMYRSMDKADDPRTDFFDMNYNKLDMRMRDPNSDTIPPMPKCFEKMKELAAVLSAGIPHLRVDFYEVDNKVYFGELTFFHCAGFAKVYPEEWGDVLGEWIRLPEVNKYDRRN